MRASGPQRVWQTKYMLNVCKSSRVKVGRMSFVFLCRLDIQLKQITRKSNR